MAIYTPEEIKEIYDEYQRHRTLNIPISQELAEQVRDADVGIKNYTQQVETSLNQLRAAGVGLFKSFKDSDQGASVFNDSLRAGADVASTFLKVLGPLGWVFGSIIKAGAEYVAAANEQSDALFVGYNKLSQLGAGFDDGVDGVYRTAQQLGYSTKELEKFSGLLEKDRQVFPMFGGTTTRGIKAYGDLADSLRGFESEFRTLGLSIDDVNQSVAGYLRLQTLTGRSQIQSQDQLSRGAYQYIQQQLLVNKLTGQNAEAQQAAEAEMTNNSVFQVAQRELRKQQQQALARGDQLEAERLEKQFNENRKLITLLPASMRKGAMDIMTGYSSASEEAQQFMRLAPTAAKMIKGQQSTAVATLDVASREAGINLDRFSGSLGKLGMMSDLFGEYSGIRDLDLATARETVAAREAQAKTEIENQKSIQGATAAYAAMLVEQRRTREAAEDVIMLGVNRATSGMRTLTTAANSAASALGGVAGTQPGQAPAGATAGRAATVREAPAGSTQALLDLIGRVESRGNYNILVGGRVEPALTNMTVAEVLEYQRGMIGRGHESTAVGKYQIIRDTLSGLVNNGAVNPNEKFSPATQDRLAIALLNGRGYQKFLAGDMSTDQFADRIAMEWASFPMPSGKSYYDKVGSNKALVDRSVVVSTLKGYQYGGVAQGPETGFQTTLHGTEAVIPLADGKSIPVTMPGYMNSMSSQTEVLAQQNSKLDSLISIMRTRNQISQKILRAYQS
jgi:muramidase (phage lysozyme)